MSITYASWLSEAANLCGTTVTQPNFVIEVPAAIDYAEQRIYRELDLVSNTVRDSTVTTAPNVRTITLPAAFIVLENINIITPAGTTPENGKRNTLQKTSEAFLDMAWPSAVGATVPRKFTVLDSNVILVGPWPDQGYVVEVIGTQRPPSLSASNTNTLLTANLPDLFLTGTMIHFSGAKRNFGAQADDPKMAVSWESQFEKLLTSANREELRKMFQGTAMEMPPGMPPPQAASG